ncbi:hypothetical protein ACWA2C_16085 [Priestia megaterium]
MNEKFELTEELIDRLRRAIATLKYSSGVNTLTEEKPMIELLKGALREDESAKHKRDLIKNIKIDLATNEHALGKHEQDQKEFEQLISQVFGASKVEAFIDRVESASEALKEAEDKEIED